jgi:predicted nucleic acid-binding protein
VREAVEEGASTEIAALSGEVFRRGFAFYRERQDKTWSLTVMQDRGIRSTLTADSDVEQAELRALLRE